MSTLYDLPNEILFQVLVDLSPQELFNFYIGSSQDISEYILDEIENGHLLLNAEDQINFLNLVIVNKKRKSYNVIRKVLNMTDEELFAKAAEYNMIDIIKHIIADNPKFKPSLEEVASFGRWDIFDYLVSLGVNDWNGAMKGLVKGGYLDKFRYLSETLRSSEVSYQYEILKRAIEVAIEQNNAEILDYLLKDERYKYYEQNSDTYTDDLIRYAAKMHSDDALQVLFSKFPAEFNYTTALNGACEGGQIDLIQKFVNLGADITRGCMYYVGFGNQIDVIDYIISLGEDDFNEGLKGAARANNIILLNYFIELGANEFEGALYEANFSSDVEIIDRLVNLSDRTDRRFFNSQLQEATSRGNIPAAIYYISKGANNYQPVIRDFIMRIEQGPLSYPEEITKEFLTIILNGGIYIRDYNLIVRAYRKRQNKEMLDFLSGFHDKIIYK